MPVRKNQNTQKALPLRQNTFLCVHLFPYYGKVISNGQSVSDHQ